jgi:hypothetical protein
MGEMRTNEVPIILKIEKAETVVIANLVGKRWEKEGEAVLLPGTQLRVISIEEGVKIKPALSQYKHLPVPKQGFTVVTVRAI